MDETPITEPTAPEPAPAPPVELDPAPTGSDAAPPAGPAATPPPAARLHRSQTSRVLGGVAGGLGERFDVDANIFRVAFVVLAVLWGVGIAIYLAMWAILPRGESAPAAADGNGRGRENGNGNGVRSRGRAARTALVAAAGTVVAVVLAVFLVASVGRGPHALRGLIVFWLLMLVILAFVVTRVAGSGRSVLRAIGALIATAVVLVVIGSGAFIAYVASTGVPFSSGIGSRAYAPVTLADVQHNYRNGIGSEIVDLSGVRFPSDGYRVHASVGVGMLTVEVPARAVVDVRTTVGAGSVTYGVPEPWGFNPTPFREIPAGLTGAALAKAPHLTLDCAVGVGRIRIERG